MPHSLDVNRLAEVFDYLESQEDRLTEWEQEFIQSVYEQWDETNSLSERQLEVLEQIHIRH